MISKSQSSSRSIRLESQVATERLSQTLASIARTGDVIALFGNLGAGKSTFARAFIRHLTPPDEDVPSPTFTLVQVYEPTDPSTPLLWHFDLYRLEDPEEALALDIDDAFSTGISLVEWPDRLGNLLPGNRLEIHLSFAPPDDGHDVRIAQLEAFGETWQSRVGMIYSEFA